MVLKSSTGISIGGKVDGQTKLRVYAATGQVVIHGKVDGGSATEVLYYGVTNIDVLGDIRTSVFGGTAPTFLHTNWVDVHKEPAYTPKSLDTENSDDEDETHTIASGISDLSFGSLLATSRREITSSGPGKVERMVRTDGEYVYEDDIYIEGKILS